MQLKPLRAHVDPAHPIRRGIVIAKPCLPTRERVGGGFCTARDDADVFAALGHKAHFGGKAIESGGERFKRFEEVASARERRLSKFPRGIARGQAEFPNERNEIGTGVCQIRNVSQIGPRDRLRDAC